MKTKKQMVDDAISEIVGIFSSKCKENYCPLSVPKLRKALNRLIRKEKAINGGKRNERKGKRNY